ncbi:MAG: alanine racemase [Rickettsiales bacterium]|nr:MAG: alanine racemase [Rickettsiales bacterium]
MNNAKCSLQINLQTIKENYIALRKLCIGSEVGAAVKANSYGLGASRIAPVLQESGCKHFFVATCEEGVDLRQTLRGDANIYVLNGVFQNELEYFINHNLTPVLNNPEQVEIWQHYAARHGRRLPCFIHIDTGMHRLGFSSAEASELELDLLRNNLDILCVMSHLASAEEVDNPFNKTQLERFTQRSAKFGDIKRSLANSSGIFLGRDYHFNLARPGAALYGINPAPYLENLTLKNPVKLSAPIIQLRDLPPGESVGYNSTHTNRRGDSCSIATIAIGYADGLHRALSNKGVLYINGFEAPIIGRVSMDLTAIDLSNIPKNDVFLGQMVEVIGENSSPDELAKFCGTNGYEILATLGKRFKKIYTG